MQRLSQTLQFIFSFRPPPSGRNTWVDTAKGIAIIFVVYRHVIYGLLYKGVNITPVLMDANEMLYGFRMPLFFFLAGLFYSFSLKKRGTAGFLVSKINSWLYPYLLWCLISLTLQLFFIDYTNAKRGVDSYLDILIHPRSMLQLWYLFALFNVAAVFLFMDKVVKLKPWMHLVFGILLVAIKPLAGDISTLTDVMLHYVYFAIGIIAAPYFFNPKVQEALTSVSKVTVLLPVFLIAQYYCMLNQNMNIFLYSALAMIGGLLVIMISMLLAKYNKLGFLQILGHYSLYIYLLHVAIIFMLRTVILHFGIPEQITGLTFFLVAAGIFLSVVVYRLTLALKIKYLFYGPFREPAPRQEGRKLPLKMHLL